MAQHSAGVLEAGFELADACIAPEEPRYEKENSASDTEIMI